ncbi:MAG TPA: DUF2252 domain-containing protein [Hyphomicrobium sp.]|nr:DUF2252 domain-containing protein [Hyphomicrobium sp.]
MVHPTNGDGSTLQSRAERFDAGKRLRSRTPRESHADYTANAQRDPIAILSEADATRIPELLPLRYRRMAASPFAFLRGAAAIMARDLGSMPSAGIPVHACGDCHLMNFNAVATPENDVLFDINDFDETLPGVDFTVDLKRLVASVAVAARDAGMDEKTARSIARSTARAYREFMITLAELDPLKIWHTRMVLEREVKLIDDAKLRNRILAELAKAEKDPAADDNFPHLATVKGGELRIEDRPPTIYHLNDAKDAQHTIRARSVFAAYDKSLPPERRVLVDRYTLRDLAFKVVGVGSVGTFCAVGLFATGDGEPLFLQIKEAQASVLEHLAHAPPIAHQGQRVVEGQKIMQAASDIFLGWTDEQKTGRFFYVRHLKNRRLGWMGEAMKDDALTAYATLCGRTLARAHARSCDPATLAGYMGKGQVLDDAMASFAMAYAAQTKRDHTALTRWLEKSGVPKLKEKRHESPDKAGHARH